MAGIKNYSTTAGNNSAAPPNGFPEGMAPAALNDGMRQVMADIRSWYNDPLWRDLGNTPTYISSNSFTITGNVTENYLVGERIRMYGTTMGTLYGTILTSSFSAPNTTISVTMDSGTLTSNLSSVSMGVLSAGDPIPFAAINGSGTAASLNFITSITGSPSDVEIPTEKAVTDYVPTIVNASLVEVGRKSSSSSTYDSSTSVIPWDNTIPQITEGKEFLTISYTPKYADSFLVVSVSVALQDVTGGQYFVGCIYESGTANALAAGADYSVGSGGAGQFTLQTDPIASGSILARTYTFRYGPHFSSTAYINGIFGGARFGGVSKTHLTVVEYRNLS